VSCDNKHIVSVVVVQVVAHILRQANYMAEVMTKFDKFDWL